ncbi:MAG TPA: hypothetical protein VIY72_12765, partial [Acidimicrobiales bacterium]
WLFPTSAPLDVVGAEKVWVFNPGDTDVQVRVQVQLDEPGVNGTVEPFEQNVPAHRAVPITIIDSDDDPANDRVPKGVPHWVLVQSTDGADIVAQRMLTGTDLRGVSYAIGIPVVATRWLLPVAGAAAVGSSLVAVANPSATETATVTLRRQGGGSVSDVESAIEIPPGEFRMLDLVRAGLTEGAMSAEVVSDHPVVVGQWIGFSSPSDIATPLGIPVVGTLGLPFDLIAPGVASGELDTAPLPSDDTLVDPASVPTETTPEG